MIFQSTLPARGATRTAQRRFPCSRNFNPRSPHGERRRRIAACRGGHYFNPRSPHGERHYIIHTLKTKYDISIHAPRTGSDAIAWNSCVPMTISIHAPRTGRYIAYDDQKKSVEDVVTYVNIGLDQPYFTNMDTIQDTKNPLMLINKYHKLPDGYEPVDLTPTPNACVIGEDYSCQSEPQYLVKEVAEAFEKLVEAGKQEGINIKAIASYRSFAYQKNLYDYYANTEGKDYAALTTVPGTGFRLERTSSSTLYFLASSTLRLLSTCAPRDASSSISSKVISSSLRVLRTLRGSAV